MSPGLFHSVSDVNGLRASGWHFDEFLYSDLYVFYAIMSTLGKMFSKCFLLFFFGYIAKMSYKSVFYTYEGFSYILFATLFACDGVDQIGASTMTFFMVL